MDDKILAGTMASRAASPPRSGQECVREDALPAWGRPVPCEVTTHVAEGNCVVARRSGKQPEANG